MTCNEWYQSSVAVNSLLLSISPTNFLPERLVYDIYLKEVPFPLFLVERRVGLVRKFFKDINSQGEKELKDIWRPKSKLVNDI